MAHTVVILAAGVGRRLGVPGDAPKWLAPLGGTVPGELQLAACAAAPEVGDVVVVTGHGAEQVVSFIAPWHDKVHIETVLNPRYRDLNNWYSVLLGLDAIEGRRPDGVFILNSDLCAPVEWFVQLFADMASAGEAGLAIDFERELTDEAMKVEVTTERRLVNIGKVGVVAPAGEYVGLTFLTLAGARSLGDMLAKFVVEPDRANAWYEHGIQECLFDGDLYRGVPVPSGRWMEVDTPEDLAMAVGLLAGG